MHAARFSGIFTVGVVVFGSLWYFSSGPTGESDQQPIVPDAEQVAEPQALAAEIVPKRFSPIGSRILTLRGDGLPFEGLEGTRWHPVIDVDAADEEVDLEALRGIFDDFDGLTNGFPRDESREEFAQFAMNGLGFNGPIRLISSSSASGGAPPAGPTNTTHKGISFDPDAIPSPTEDGSPDSGTISSLILVNVVEEIGPPTNASLTTGQSPLTPNSVPEPATLLLLATGICLGSRSRKRRN